MGSATTAASRSRESGLTLKSALVVPTELSRRELSWVIGGPQGGGINASAEIYAKALTRGGLHVFANIEFHSNIMGKHSYYRVTAAPVPVRSHVDEIHVLVALDQESLFGDALERKHYPSHTGHVHQVAPGGGIVYDADLKIDPTQFRISRSSRRRSNSLVREGNRGSTS